MLLGFSLMVISCTGYRRENSQMTRARQKLNLTRDSQKDTDGLIASALPEDNNSMGEMITILLVIIVNNILHKLLLFYFIFHT